MASDWRITYVLVDTKGLKTSMNFLVHSDDVLLADGFTAVNAVMDALKTDLDAVTDANFYSETLSLLKAGSTSLPADADITDVAMVTTYLTGAGELPKYHVLRIPAPVAGIFTADGKTIDIADAGLIAYVANFLDGIVQVSDGEYIDATIDNGIKGGSWTSVKRNSKSVQAS